jgi:Glycosyl hydrolase catalytic core/Beta-galactosidase
VTIDSSQDCSTATPSPRVLALAAGTLLAAVAVSVLVWGAGSPVAAAGHDGRARVPPKFFGVQPGPTTLDETDAAKIAKTGVRTVRIGLNWTWVQPRPGPFHWTRIDGQVSTLAASGVEAFPIIAGTPSWIASEPTTPPLGSAGNRKAWKAFVTAAVRRYGPGGTFWQPGLLGKSPFNLQCGCDALPVPIRAWQVWNEPNLTHYFTPDPSPSEYASLLRITHSAITKADRGAKVVLAGLSDGGRTEHDVRAIPYLERLYHVDGVKRTFDAMAIHPYARKVRGMRDILNAVRRAMKAAHDRRTPVYVTEIGWGSARPNGFGTTKGIRGQRRIVQRSMKMLLDRRKAWHLRRVYWFYWRDPPKSTTGLPCRICYSAGLLRSSREPKPAYRTFKRIARRAL